MGWDVKATADSFAQSLPEMPTVASDLTLPQAANWVMIGLVVLGVAAVLARLVPRLWTAAEQTFFTNWRLALLGSSALLLSVAGGYTTWDGMKNFTGESVLSALFTFGIHGVMLIVAWLIGESFATGMNQVRGTYARRVSPPLVALSVFGGGLVLVAFATWVVRVGVSDNQVLYGTLIAGALLLATSMLVLFSRSDVVQPYAQGLRIIAKNGMLWVMFFACMATSVFFSFDSRFNVIFPQDQRERAAEIRTKNQVAGVVADIGDTITSRRLTEAQRLFESEGWKLYDQQLEALAKASQGAESLIEAHFTREMEAHRAGVAEQQERIATAVSGQAGLSSKKAALTDELSRLRTERPGLAAELSGKKTELENRAKEIDAKRVEAMAEDKGVEGTLKQGKGPIYRERMAELGRLRDYYKIGEERVRDAQKRLDTLDTRVAQIERELAGVDGELARLIGEAQTAEQRIKVSESFQLGGEGPKVDPARVRAAFETARLDFRQQPDAERLGVLYQHCVQLHDAMMSTEATKERVRSVDCDPKQATEAAAQMFALNAGQKAYDTNCAGGDKVPETGGVDPLLQFGRKCLQDSGLASKDSAEMAAKLSFIDLNRDDKAHNFVVSLNAFEDGNRLAYLALVIAIGIDSLIFMTGLFGANAVRSPLSDVPSLKARNSQQLNAMIEAALLPDPFRKARLVVQSMHPIENKDGYSNEVRLAELDPETAMQVREVLNAGAIIGAVRNGVGNGHYLVRSELLEFLNTIVKRELEVNSGNAQLALRLDQLEEQLTVALMPAVGANSDAVLRNLVPIDEANGFTAEVELKNVAEEVRPPMWSVLNTGATFQLVQKAQHEHYFVHKDLYKTLARIRARQVARGGFRMLEVAARGERYGGVAEVSQPKITDQTRVLPVSPDAQIEDGEIRSHYLEVLVEALGVEPRHLSEISANAFSAAVQASLAFQHARQTNHDLDRELGDKEEDAHKAFQMAYDNLYNSISSGDEWKRQQLHDAYSEVEQTWGVLMLLPNGPFEAVLRQLVEDLEPDNGAGSLKVEQAALYAAARRLSEALTTNARDTDAHWMQLERNFHQAARAQPQQVSLGDGKRTLN